MRTVTTQTGFYTDPDFEEWGPLTCWLYRYLYENDHAHGITGIGRISPRVMTIEAKLTKAQFETARAEMDGKVVWFPDGAYWVKGRAKHTCFTSAGKVNPKLAANAKLFLATQSADVQAAFLARYPLLGHAWGIDTLSIGQRPEKNLTTVAVTDSVAVAVTDSVSEERETRPKARNR